MRACTINLLAMNLLSLFSKKKLKKIKLNYSDLESLTLHLNLVQRMLRLAQWESNALSALCIRVGLGVLLIIFKTEILKVTILRLDASCNQSTAVSAWQNLQTVRGGIIC